MIALTEASSPVPIYRLKITLIGSKPPIWRRFLVRADIKLNRLDRVIQTVMGWENYHLHEFIVRSEGQDLHFGVPDPDYESWGQQMLNEKRYALSDLLAAPRSKLKYIYDFGDGWQHELRLEKILPGDPNLKHPICLAGANACPPEDSGGLWGYYGRFLKALNDPNHEDHAMYTQWIGGSFDPAFLDLDAINAALRRLKA
jgi:hypothetical protein